MKTVGKSYGKRRVNVGFGYLCSGKMCGILNSGGKIRGSANRGSTQSGNEIGDRQAKSRIGIGRPSDGPGEFGPRPAGGGGGVGVGDRECENIIRQIFSIFFINFFYKIFIKNFFIKFSVT